MDQRIQIILMLMSDELRRAWTPTELAAVVNLSPSRLQHLFKQETGTTPARYLRALRLERAKALLETSLLSVKQIMHNVGIKDRSHFEREFKRAYGLTPAQCRATMLLARPIMQKIAR
jgi:AraC family transcriptional regulator, arabinose operon regulatory protein